MLVLRVLIVHARDVVVHVVFAPEAAYVTLATIDGAEKGTGGVEVVSFLLVTCERIFVGELFVFAFKLAADVSLKGGFDMFSSLRGK
jgi:hypothetical protein